MPNPVPADSIDRIRRLEERLVWLERHVTEQDKAMLEQAKILDRVLVELRLLRERAAGGGLGAAGEGGVAADERPPHY
jgi:SlyX protein